MDGNEVIIYLEAGILSSDAFYNQPVNIAIHGPANIAILSAIRLEIISNHPIKDGLCAFRQRFESTRTDLGVVESSNTVRSVLSRATAAVAKNLVLDLILALQNEPAARILPSQNGHGTLLRDLSNDITLLDSNNFDITLAILCLDEVAPLAASEKSTFDTPIRSSSASQIGFEQTHNEVDQRILEELTGRVYYDVGGFYERYFEDKSWINSTRDIYEESRAQYAEGFWRGWPEPSFQGLFFEWFMKFQDTILGGLGRRYYTSANKVLRGSEAGRKLDMFLTPADAVLVNGEHDWSNVLVIGEHKQNPEEDRSIKTLVQLAWYAREVFGSQPGRRFIPGFTFCGSVMRLWVFDRSGSYNSEKFDIHKESERFITVIAGYAVMTVAELGLNVFIKRDGISSYIIADDSRILLEDSPIASTKAISCRGTTCYRARKSGSTNWQYVVKLAWPSDKRQREGDLLKLAKDRGVKGIAEWLYYEQIAIDGSIDTIAQLRAGLKFGAPRKLSSKASWVGNSVECSSVYSRTRSLRRSRSSAAHLIGMEGSTSGTTASSGQKRKRDGVVDDENVGKRNRSINSRSSVANVENAVDTENHELETAGQYSIEEAKPDSLGGCGSETYGNRIHCCLVVFPAGRPLHSYRSVKELLGALHDAIRGHKSLLEDGKILHRDISENNIIITEATTKEDYIGMLIDLDLAKELDSLPSGASHRTGTMQFMAIEVLQGKGHTYRHDLESFFYVFIWMCIRYGYEDIEQDSGPIRSPAKKTRTRSISTSRLQKWYTGTYIEIARTKLGDMDKNGFEDIIAEFAPQFENQKQLARELRSTLFPIRDGAIFTGTLRDSNIMYGKMIDAFTRAIDRLRKEEQPMP
ncbi:hypothetical protein BOTCAL_0526g00030 [Botryotinia calthae]|uniref:EKC/KEOPS complex subunit BUD32 n=1 Tax=Botryotinia calthae TaxID=38488 RepID=A0A4Y8CLF0_9HELO|nr:hypothetical protein BOTCAL_0526g00030 [Botryotinia calthae]